MFAIVAIIALGKLDSPTQERVSLPIEKEGKGGWVRMLKSERELDVSVKYNTRSIYHLLCRAFGQCVAISQVVDFNIANVVAICNVHLTIDCTCAVAPSGSSGRS